MTEQPKFRILSLDGGGVRGLLSARILENLEKYLDAREGRPKPLGERFDFIVGTSTGAILAAGLASGLTARRLHEIYAQDIPNIFPPKSSLASWCGPKYSQAPLRELLKEHFGDTRLADLETDLCITAVDLQTGRPRLYKTGYLKRNQGRLEEPLVEAVLASAAAPTYFPPVTTLAHSSYLVDGGLCANNPAMVALVDALQFEHPGKVSGSHPAGDLNQVVMVSLGTGMACGMPYDSEQLIGAGIWRWAKPVIELTFQSQSHLVHAQVSFLLKERYLRIDPPLPFAVKLDDAAALPRLASLGDLNQAQTQWIEQHLTGESE